MFGIVGYTTFLVSSIVLNLTPGVDTVYILTKAIAGGRRVDTCGLGTEAKCHATGLRSVGSIADCDGVVVSCARPSATKPGAQKRATTQRDAIGVVHASGIAQVDAAVVSRDAHVRCNI